jgi:hypothetical protein
MFDKADNSIMRVWPTEFVNARELIEEALSLVQDNIRCEVPAKGACHPKEAVQCMSCLAKRRAYFVLEELQRLLGHR